jgi:hypothetical protein
VESKQRETGPILNTLGNRSCNLDDYVSIHHLCPGNVPLLSSPLQHLFDLQFPSIKNSFPTTDMSIHQGILSVGGVLIYLTPDRMSLIDSTAERSWRHQLGRAFHACQAWFGEPPRQLSPTRWYRHLWSQTSIEVRII